MWQCPENFLPVPLRFLLTHPVWDVTGIPTDITPVWTNFYSHIPCGMWHGNGLSINSSIKISTHTSRVGCDLPALHNIANRFYFYSHIPCGMWPILEAQGEQQYDFYSHIPCGMWRPVKVTVWRSETFLLTHPVWDVTETRARKRSNIYISTHTSRVGCDFSPSKALMCM